MVPFWMNEFDIGLMLQNENCRQVMGTGETKPEGNVPKILQNIKYHHNFMPQMGKKQAVKMYKIGLGSNILLYNGHKDF